RCRFTDYRCLPLQRPRRQVKNLLFSAGLESSDDGMPKHKVTCRCGHSWQYSATGPIPADVSSICPICTAASEHTVEQSSASPELAAGSEGTNLKSGHVLGSFEIL